MNELLINGIYKNMIKTIIEGINDSDVKSIMVAYKNYLYENYADTLDNSDDIKQIIVIYSNIERKKWQKKSEREKKSILLKDENLIKLQEISDIAYKHASRKIGCIISGMEYIPSISEEQIISYTNEMKRLFELVKDFNKTTARMYLSEGIIDFEYSLNKTENMSLRTARLK